MRSDLAEEFVASMGVYVRVAPDDTIVDTRGPTLEKMIELGTEAFVEFMQDVPQDAAAILSQCTAAIARSSSIEDLFDLEKEELRQHLVDQRVAGKPLLVVKAGHPAVAFVDDLLATVSGAEMYRDIAYCLAQAPQRGDLRPHCFLPPQGAAAIEVSETETDDDLERSNQTDASDEDAFTDEEES